MTAKEKKPVLLLVDGNALIHRGFHALPHLSTKQGEPVSGVYGFALLFLNALKEVEPAYAAVSFDLPGPTFRDKLYKEYKATRVAAPDELYQQIPRVKELVQVFNLPTFEKEGFEADDLIGTLAKQADRAGVETIIVTGDYDTLQLVNHNIKVFAPKKGLAETQLFGEREVNEKYGLAPEQLVDFKALRGDPSDNIPGVAGVGDKTAKQLLQTFGGLDEIYEYLKKYPDGGKKIKPRVAKMLMEHKEKAYLSQKLARIMKDVPVKLDLKKAELGKFDEEKLVSLFQALEFKSLLAKVPKLQPKKTSERFAEVHYLLVDSKRKLEEFVKELKAQREFAIDTETTNEHPMQAELLGIGFSWKEGRACYLPVEIASQSRELIDILENPKIKKIGHNIKYDYLILKRAGLSADKAGIHLAGISFDTMIAAYLLNPGARNFDLDTLAFTEFGYRMQPIEELIGPPHPSTRKKGEGAKKQKSMGEVPVQAVSDYCCEDADFTRRLKQKLMSELKQKNLERVFYEIEMPLIRVLAEMEYIGVKVEPKILQVLSKEAEKEIGKIEQKIYRLAGEKFNIGSPIQLKQILFEKLEIPTAELKKGKTGISTAASELEKLRGQHPVIDLLFDWRELSKLKSTYLDALPDLINPETNRIHTSFNQTIAATGRLSSSDPNLQNIPIRTPLGRKVRGAFVAEVGFKLVSVDYSQIELRIGAHLSGDKKMIKVFNQGGDIHTATAQEVFGIKEADQVTARDRRLAKVINFGVFYGLSAYGLTSRIPEVSQVEAEEFIDKYKSVYQELTDYLDEIVEETKQKGYVTNELGRLRNLPEINSSQYQVRAAAERAAVNMPLQSLAADIIKMAMNQLAHEDLIARNDCRLLLQVHDELLFEIAGDKVEPYSRQIAKIMESVYKLRVPLEVEAKVGNNWEKMEKINP